MGMIGPFPSFSLAVYVVRRTIFLACLILEDRYYAWCNLPDFSVPIDRGSDTEIFCIASSRASYRSGFDVGLPLMVKADRRPSCCRLPMQTRYHVTTADWISFTAFCANWGRSDHASKAA